MVIILFLLCLISFGLGVMSSLTATTVFHQIVGAVSYVNACILLIGAAIVDAINNSTNVSSKHLKKQSDYIDADALRKHVLETSQK